MFFANQVFETHQFQRVHAEPHQHQVGGKKHIRSWNGSPQQIDQRGWVGGNAFDALQHTTRQSGYKQNIDDLKPHVTGRGTGIDFGK